MDETTGSERLQAPRCPRGLVFACAWLTLLLPACYSNGQLNLFGYTTKPNYDTRYKTVRITIFKNKTFWATTPVPGMEMDLTRVLEQYLQDQTPYKVVGAGQPADTELIGTITGFQKLPLIYNQLNEQRAVETTLVCEVVWRECATGKILSQVGRPTGDLTPPDVPLGPQPLGSTPMSSAVLAQTPVASAATQPTTGPLDAVSPLGGVIPPPNLPTPGGAPQPIPQGVVIRSLGHYQPELGQSITTAMQENYKNMAVQIVSMMEVPW